MFSSDAELISIDINDLFIRRIREKVSKVSRLQPQTPQLMTLIGNRLSCTEKNHSLRFVMGR